MSELCKAPASASAPAPTTDTPRPAGLLQGLGLIGLSSIEAPVLAALATEEPLLLIGPHGTAKSLMLTRIAASPQRWGWLLGTTTPACSTLMIWWVFRCRAETVGWST